MYDIDVTFGDAINNNDSEQMLAAAWFVATPDISRKIALLMYITESLFYSQC